MHGVPPWNVAIFKVLNWPPTLPNSNVAHHENMQPLRTFLGGTLTLIENWPMDLSESDECHRSSLTGMEVLQQVGPKWQGLIMKLALAPFSARAQHAQLS